MVKKKNVKPEKIKHTVDSLSKTVRDISANRKMEVEGDEELSAALCGLADYAGDLFLTLLRDTIKTPCDEDKKKDMLLVLHLTYLRLSAEILEEEAMMDSAGEIPISGCRGTSPVDMKKENVPMYL